MLTVLESIKLSAEYLKNKGIQSPRINAELLLAEILNCKRLDLYLSFDKPLTENEISKYREWIRRRGKFEPLQYIIGKTEFYGLTFLINKNVLIPRQETEILVETILNDYESNGIQKILDIGTGSGNIAIALAKFLPNSHITAVDISTDAITVAKKNAQLNSVDKLIQFIILDITKEGSISQLQSSYDIIVSNPPYIPLNEYKTLQKEITDYEPIYAVTDKENGFRFYKIISNLSQKLLNKYGKLYFEVGKEQAKFVKKIMIENNFKNIKTKKDYLGIERVLTGEKL
ncbi:peptide chain release factor N(5)-glutamine methyltransferase [Melioribacteraceae bacterium 4301-Me]|uniref:peptide chain release factor N(5)-glutamine methyltransferase n=1 Tax=Pyranulibacter aquaticus TaxID=3163344 RepID=UPI00359AAA00